MDGWWNYYRLPVDRKTAIANIIETVLLFEPIATQGEWHADRWWWW